MPEAPRTGSARPVDPVALARIAQRLRSAAQPPWLHGEVARRMAERLPLILQQPRCVVDWASRTGASAAWLTKTYPQARQVAVDAGELPRPDAVPRSAAPDRSARSGPSERSLARWWPWRRPAQPVAVHPDTLGEGIADLLWSNMALHGEADPQALFVRWRRLLAPDGFLMFSTLGPGTLQELRELYQAQRWPAPMAPLVDMHDLGDMLVQAGFGDPVMDQETLTLTWPDARALLAELRSLGGNADPSRMAGLRTPRWRVRLEQALQAGADSQGRIALTLEVVYGHAFAPAPRVRVQAAAVIGVQQLRDMARRGRT